MANSERKQDEEPLHNEFLNSTAAELHRRTLRFAVSVATRLVLPDVHLVGGYALGRAYWYTFDDRAVTQEDVDLINERVKQLVEGRAAIQKKQVPWKEAVEYFEANQQPFAAALLRTRVSEVVDVHVCEGEMRLDLFPLLENVGMLAESKVGFVYDVRFMENNILAVYDNQGEYLPQPAIAESFKDHLNWAISKKVRCLGHLNEVTINQSVRGRNAFVLSAESRQDQKIAIICEQIMSRGNIRVLCIAGPTSSGKTTFAHKLSLYLSNYGVEATPLTVDHYYHDLDDQPRFKLTGDRTKVDYDHIESMDVALVNRHANELIAGKEVMVPKYDFKSGRRVGGTPLSITHNGILIMEGIHALNPDYINGLDPDCVYKIYISPLTTLLTDDFNAVKSTQHRLLRRMTRDYLFRGYGASHTLMKWPTVRAGEHRYIFQYQNNADFVMNSAMEYEIPVLKVFTSAILHSVGTDDPNFDRAQELSRLLYPVAPWPDRPVPGTSLLREFIGDGAFDVH